MDINIEYQNLDLEDKIAPILKRELEAMYKMGKEDMALDVLSLLKTLHVNLINDKLSDREIVEFAKCMSEIIKSTCDNAVVKF